MALQHTHASLVSDDLLLEEVYKGCSTFEYEEFNKGKIENVTSSKGLGAYDVTITSDEMPANTANFITW